jgi:16S rRNA (guanine966-N2)-methyltransferase
MRIIGGKWRSRRLEVPPTDRTRPMPDRVKESIFDILGTRFGTPGLLPPVQVADFFSGSGSLGLEAVSRGATGCTFIERDRAVLKVLRRNIEALHAGPELLVVSADAWKCSAARLLGWDQPGDVVFLDPPYADTRNCGPKGKAARLLRRLVQGPCLTDEGIIVLHHEKAVRFEPDAADRWTVVDRREYGSTAISFLAPAKVG